MQLYRFSSVYLLGDQAKPDEVYTYVIEGNALIIQTGPPSQVAQQLHAREIAQGFAIDQHAIIYKNSINVD